MGSNGVRLFVPPFQDPVNPNLDPALVEAMSLVGTQMAAALYDAGMTGVAHQQTYDLWWHGGFRSTPTRHNMVGILTEAASTRLGSPITLSSDSVRQPGRGVNYPAPWPGGVEVWRAAESFTADGQTYAAGSLVVPMGQPYRAHAKDLLEAQHYTPVADRPPYDVAGWTLPFTMGVRADVVNTPFNANLVRVDSVTPTPGRIEGSGEIFFLKNRTNAESRAVAALLAAGQTVSVVGDSLMVRGPRARTILSEHAARHGFTVTAVRTAPASGQGAARQRLPRIGLYQPWTGNIDEGWTRWLFEQYGISYTTLHDADDKKGGLLQRIEVRVVPDYDR